MWKAQTNAAGHTYYRNLTTGEARWDDPSASSSAPPSSSSLLSSPSSRVGLTVGGGWTLYRDPTADHPYYYNEKTHESLWAEEWEGRYGSSLSSSTPLPTPPVAGHHHEVSFYDLPVHPPGSSDLDAKFQDLLDSPAGQLQLEKEVSSARGAKATRLRERGFRGRP